MRCIIATVFHKNIVSKQLKIYQENVSMFLEDLK